MSNVLAITGPIYLSIAVGFVATRSGFMSKVDAQVLGRFVLSFALPAMLFNALASRDFQEVIHPVYLAAYALGSLVAFGTMWALGRWIVGHDMTLRAFMGMGSSCSNTGYIGYPILLQVIGPSAGVGLALCLLVENLLMIPLSLSLAESGQAGSLSWQRQVIESFKRMARAPLMWAIVLGFFFSMMGWHWPQPLARTIDLFAAACAGTALFVNGASLVGLRVQGLVSQVSGIALAKLILHPSAVAFFLWLLGPIEPRLQISAIVLAAMPMLGIYPLFAQRFGRDGFCAAALLMTTLLSFFTISALLWGLSGWPAGQSVMLGN